MDGITITTISVRMLKNKPRMPQPNGLRPLVAAISAHTIAAMTLPIGDENSLDAAQNETCGLRLAVAGQQQLMKHDDLLDAE